jgi:hypothetical protein
LFSIINVAIAIKLHAVKKTLFFKNDCETIIIGCRNTQKNTTNIEGLYGYHSHVFESPNCLISILLFILEI